MGHILYFFTFLTLTLCEHYWVKTDDESYLVEMEENGGVGINANDREDGTDYKDQSLEKLPFYLGREFLLSSENSESKVNKKDSKTKSKKKERNKERATTKKKSKQEKEPKKKHGPKSSKIEQVEDRPKNKIQKMEKSGKRMGNTTITIERKEIKSKVISNKRVKNKKRTNQKAAKNSGDYGIRESLMDILVKDLEQGDEQNSGFTTNFINEVLDNTNNFRAAHGKPALELSEKFSKAAQVWADHLAATCTLEHGDAVDKTQGVKAENLQSICGLNQAGSVVVAGWENSAEHRDNMLMDDITKIGVGMVQTQGCQTHCTSSNKTRSGGVVVALYGV